MFKSIQIQTLAACNLQCRFCPNSVIDREPHYMSIPVYKKILDNLRKIEFKGRVLPYLMNEPLLDGRLPVIVRMTRDTLPNCEITINTNGTKLDFALLDKLVDAGLSNMVLNNYSTIPINQELKAMLQGQAFQSDKKHFYIDVREVNTEHIRKYFYNRAGNIKVPEVPVRDMSKADCPYPHESMYINADGDSILCCSDWRNTVRFGNIQLHSLEEIWESNKYSQYRKELETNGRVNLELCRDCDYAPPEEAANE